MSRSPVCPVAFSASDDQVKVRIRSDACLDQLFQHCGAFRIAQQHFTKSSAEVDTLPKVLPHGSVLVLKIDRILAVSVCHSSTQVLY